MKNKNANLIVKVAVKR